MKTLFFTLVILLAPVTLYGQCYVGGTRYNKHHISLEAGGAGGLGSINYEHTLLANPENFLLFRLGLSYTPLTVNGRHAIGTPIMPIGLYYLYGNKHHFELGLNNTFGYTFDNISDDNEFTYMLVPSIGFRFENFKKSRCISVWRIHRESFRRVKKLNFKAGGKQALDILFKT